LENVKYESSALFEQRFWLQVLGDHARFILNSLSPTEQVEIRRAEYFIQGFDQLLEEARRSLNVQEIQRLNESAYQKMLEIRAFKLHLLERHLTEKISLNLPPTFLNHMVNEVEEAILVTSFLLKGELPPIQSSLHLHLLWLLDAAGHAGGIENNLDLAEKKLKEISKTFMNQFQEYYLKAVEFAGFIRTNLHQFPALSRLNKEVELEMSLFLEFLRELEEMRLTKEALGALSPLMADHMAREELYYLLKLSQVSEVKPPSGDPSKPRKEE
jgi:hypothetical protein